MKKTIERISETKNWFFEKINLISFFSQTHHEKKRFQINKIRNEKEKLQLTSQKHKRSQKQTAENYILIK